MKIRLSSITEEIKKLGFVLNDIYEVQEIEVSGDFCAYDVWYKIQSKTNEVTWMQDLFVKELDSNDKFDKFIDILNEKIFNNNEFEELPYKFKFNFSLNFVFYLKINKDGD